jgi:hypothetical protein
VHLAAQWQQSNGLFSIFWIKVFQSNGAKLLWVDTYALVTRVLIEGNYCSQWDGLVQVVRCITLFSSFFKFMGEIQEELTLHLGCVEY